jgi:hypothetical protein
MGRRLNPAFDVSRLPEGERLVRAGPARLQTATPARWWHGDLFLTTARIIFVPAIANPHIPPPAFSLAGVVDAGRAGWNGFHVRDGHATATFELPAPASSVRGMAGRLARPWLAALAGLRPAARAPGTRTPG